MVHCIHFMEQFCYIVEKLWQLEETLCEVSNLKKQNYVFYEKNKYSIHAEFAAINNCKNKKILKECIMYVVRVGGDHCHCCEMCQKFIIKNKIRKVYTLFIKN